jgi:O-antigen/teichoic acid export membrane protein
MADKPATTSHAEALKSTSIIGGSTAVTILVRIVRTKVLASLLGPTGIGLEAIYDSVVNLARTFLDLGISSSGVRQIAASMASGGQRLVATTVITLRRVCLILGILGAIALYVFREPVSRMAFDNTDHARDVGLLSIILLLGSVAGGQGALLQGARRIGDLARMKIIGSVAGAGVSIPFVYFWGREGIVPYMIVAAAVGGLISWVYARRIKIERVNVSLPELTRETANLLKLGIVFVATGLMSTGALFLIRILVTRMQGLDGVGQFQAASALSTIYVGFILQAMGTDFYPRLTSVAEDNRRCNQLVNEQSEISILLALPGVLGTLAAAPWVIRLFYTSKFDLAPAILYWQVAGTFLQVNSWPLGFILVAKGRSIAYFWTELAAYSAYVLFGWLGLKYFGLPGVGMAFLGLYVFHWVMVYVVVRKISGFALSPGNIRLSLIGVIAVGIGLCTRLTLPEPWPTAVGGILTITVGIYFLKILICHAGSEKVLYYSQKLRLSFLVRKLL